MFYFIIFFFIVTAVLEKIGYLKRFEKVFEDKFIHNFFSNLGLNYFASFFDAESIGSPEDFETSLLALSSLIIKADGVVNNIASNYVRDYYIENYGKEKSNTSFRNFKAMSQQDIPTHRLCLEINNFMSYPARLELIVFFFDVANSNEFISYNEEFEIRTIASYMLIQNLDYMRLHDAYFEDQNSNESNYSSVYSQSSNYEYEVLGLTENATIGDIKKAYRTLVKRYHPDRVQNVSVESLNIAKEKFQSIQSAYEKIKSERGF